MLRPARRPKVHYYFVAVAELAFVITVLCTSFSIWLNSVRFGQWGFNFLSVATPSDILMSGWQMSAYGFRIAVLMAIYATGIFLVVLVVRKLTKNNRHRRMIVSATIVVLVVTDMQAALWLGASRTYIFDIYTIATASAALLYIALHRHALGERVLVSVVAFIALAISSGIALTRMGQIVGESEKIGGRFIVPVDDGQPLACDSPPILVWMGSSSIIASCSKSAETGPIRHDYFILVDRQRAQVVDDSGAFKNRQRSAIEDSPWPSPEFVWTYVGRTQQEFYTPSAGHSLVWGNDYVGSYSNDSPTRKVWLTRIFNEPGPSAIKRVIVYAEFECAAGTSRRLTGYATSESGEIVDGNLDVLTGVSYLTGRSRQRWSLQERWKHLVCNNRTPLSGPRTSENELRT